MPVKGNCPRCGWGACALWNLDETLTTDSHDAQVIVIGLMGIACAMQAVATRLAESEAGARERHRDIRERMDTITDNVQTVVNRDPPI